MDNEEKLEAVMKAAAGQLEEECNYVILACIKGNPDGRAAYLSNGTRMQAAKLMEDLIRAEMAERGGN